MAAQRWLLRLRMCAPLVSGRPRFAVLLAAYNGMLWIEQQLESILAQECVEVNVFISVDTSSDDTLPLCKRIAAQDPRVTLLPSSGRFGGAAKNFFRLIRDVDFSRYEYIALADQDDIWLKDKLLAAHERITTGKFSAYSSNVIAFWPDGRQLLIDKAQPQRKYDFLFESAGPGCSYVIRVPEALRLKYFLTENWLLVNDVSLHDWIIYAWFRANGLSWYIDRIPRILYRQHGANQLGVNIGFRATSTRLNLLRSGWYREEIAKIWRLVGYLLPEFRSNMLNDGVISRWIAFMYMNQLRRRLRDRLYLLLLVLIGVY